MRKILTLTAVSASLLLASMVSVPSITTTFVPSAYAQSAGFKQMYDNCKPENNCKTAIWTGGTDPKGHPDCENPAKTTIVLGVCFSNSHPVVVEEWQCENMDDNFFALMCIQGNVQSPCPVGLYNGRPSIYFIQQQGQQGQEPCPPPEKPCTPDPVTGQPRERVLGHCLVKCEAEFGKIPMRDSSFNCIAPCESPHILKMEKSGGQMKCGHPKCYGGETYTERQGCRPIGVPTPDPGCNPSVSDCFPVQIPGAKNPYINLGYRMLCDLLPTASPLCDDLLKSNPP